jgi:hypothetical protein
LSAFITSSPSVPQPAAMKASTKACPALKGVIQYSRAPVNAPDKHADPPGALAERAADARTTGRRRSLRLATSCITCAIDTTITRKNSRKAPRPS